MTGCPGIPLAAVDFYTELELNNHRAWWAANKGRYDTDVLEPMLALGAALADEFGAAKLFRPQRDVRFSSDKSPYKTHQGLVVHTGEAMGYYVQISGDGLMTAAGWYAPFPALVAAYRAAVDDEDAGAALERIAADLSAAGAALGGDLLKTRPKGFDADHPRIDLLRHKTVTAGFQYGLPDWLDSPALVDRVRADWRRFTPLMEWLTTWVDGGRAVRDG
ncbi:MAG: DUF2461 domain-containing protein [Micropruina sp.]|nr:MAG: DUF2461 domain-containing protein [Micropruina sp.]